MPGAGYDPHSGHYGDRLMSQISVIATNDKPEVLHVRAKQIPAELCAIPHWAVWRLEGRDGKWTKPLLMTESALMR